MPTRDVNCTVLIRTEGYEDQNLERKQAVTVWMNCE